MSFSRKVLRRVKKAMGVGAILVLAACSSQISHAVVVDFNPSTATLRFSVDKNDEDDKEIGYIWKKNYNLDSISHVVIENGVKKIGNDAFLGCEHLQKITIPNSVTSIGDNAFSGCYSLPGITIPNSVASIGKEAFFSCYYLQEITIPSSVTSIGKNAFCNCTDLQKINIPNSVTSIGEWAFAYCQSLEKITLPRSLDTIDKYAFYKCVRLKTVKFDNDNYEKNIILKEGVFEGCKELRYFNTNGLKVKCGLQAFDGTPLQHLGGRVVYGKCRCECTHGMMRRMLSQLQGANEMFQRADYIPNDDGNIKNPTNCPRSY